MPRGEPEARDASCFPMRISPGTTTDTWSMQEARIHPAGVRRTLGTTSLSLAFKESQEQVIKNLKCAAL